MTDLLLFEMYTYEEAKEKIAGIFKKMKAAPPEEEIEPIRKRCNSVMYFLKTVLQVSGILLLARSLFLMGFNKTGYFMFMSGFALYLFSYLFTSKIMDWKFWAKIFYRKHCQKYKDVDCFYSQQDFCHEIDEIIINTDVVLHERVNHKAYKIATKFCFDNNTEECSADIYYKEFDKEKHSESVIKTVKFI